MQFQVQYDDGEPSKVWTDEVGVVAFDVVDDELLLDYVEYTVTTKQMEAVAEATEELPFVDGVEIG